MMQLRYYAIKIKVSTEAFKESEDKSKTISANYREPACNNSLRNISLFTTSYLRWWYTDFKKITLIWAVSVTKSVYVHTYKFQLVVRNKKVYFIFNYFIYLFTLLLK